MCFSREKQHPTKFGHASLVKCCQMLINRCLARSRTTNIMRLHMPLCVCTCHHASAHAILRLHMHAKELLKDPEVDAVYIPLPTGIRKEVLTLTLTLALALTLTLARSRLASTKRS